MRAMPGWAARSVPATAPVVLAAAVTAAAPALWPGAATPWRTVALLAVLHLACEQLPACRPLRRVAGDGAGTAAFFPVLLAGAMLLPPAAAALVAAPALLAVPGAVRTRWQGRCRRTGQLALAGWAAAHAFHALGGPAALGGAGALGSQDAHPAGAYSAPESYTASTAPVAHTLRAIPPDLPALLLPTAAMVLVYCAALMLLAARAAPEPAAPSRVTAAPPARRAPRRPSLRAGVRSGLFARSLAPVAVHGLAALSTAVLWRSGYGPATAPLVLLPTYAAYWMFARYHRERAAHQATVRALVQAVDIKDGYTRAHSERVGRASVMIARELGMDRTRVEVLRLAGVLHDVGKLGVPTRLLRKDGPLTAQERRLIELHPEYGDEMVRGIDCLGAARAAILHHHERVDGSGYPYGLMGHQIPEVARVVAVADAFDAMTSTRAYRRARPVSAAVAELKRCAGAQFDPRMVRALVRALARHGWQPVFAPDRHDQRGNVPPERQPRPPLTTRTAPRRPPARHGAGPAA